MKIEIVELKEMEFVEVEGEFKQVFKNQKRVPCFITNFAIKKGKELGLINGSLISDLFKLQNSVKENGEVSSDAIDSLDETELQKVIYLGYVGANPNTELTFDEFIQKFHYSYEETVLLYVNLIEKTISNNPNLFAEGFKKSTKSEKKQ
ncbi:MAG: hypothetical protein K0S34_89 [Bacillales bacterium]|jgi:hypothetical protein|nr:hypothetical protein [Bacillales bacterium]